MTLGGRNAARSGGPWLQNAVAPSTCPRRTSGRCGSTHRALPTVRPIRSACRFLRDDFELSFDRPITIIVGENGTGKSTLLEGIAVLAGYDEAGGGKGYMPVDHSNAVEAMGGELSTALRASWLPKVTNGWFFRAESFFYGRADIWTPLPGTLGAAAPDFLSHSHGEGFLRFFQERCQRQGIFIFDEPESALSPARQMEFLKLMRRMEQSTICQIVMATHSPMLMAYPGARLLRLSKYGLEPVTVEQTDHYKVMREFCADPAGFVEAVVDEWTPRRREDDRY